MSTQFGIGNVLVTGFRIWTRNFVPFLLITILIHAPVAAWGMYSVQGGLDDARWRQIIAFLQISPLVVQLINILVSAALTYGVVMELQGQRASLGDCIATGLRRFLPALGTTLLVGLCVGGMAFIAAIPFAAVSGLLATISAAVAGLWILTMLYVATQASVIERPGVMAALGRSRALTKGHRFALFALFLLVQLLNWALEWCSGAIALPDIALYVYLKLACDVLIGSLSAVMAGVAYYLLRSEKEGTSAAELAAVFA